MVKFPSNLLFLLESPLSSRRLRPFLIARSRLFPTGSEAAPSHDIRVDVESQTPSAFAAFFLRYSRPRISTLLEAD